jgi:hypothetical protein
MYKEVAGRDESGSAPASRAPGNIEEECPDSN